MVAYLAASTGRAGGQADGRTAGWMDAKLHQPNEQFIDLLMHMDSRPDSLADRNSSREFHELLLLARRFGDSIATVWIRLICRSQESSEARSPRL